MFGFTLIKKLKRYFKRQFSINFTTRTMQMVLNYEVVEVRVSLACCSGKKQFLSSFFNSSFLSNKKILI